MGFECGWSEGWGVLAHQIRQNVDELDGMHCHWWGALPLKDITAFFRRAQTPRRSQRRRGELRLRMLVAFQPKGCLVILRKPSADSVR